MNNKKFSSNFMMMTALLTTMIVFLPISTSTNAFAQTNATTTTATPEPQPPLENTANMTSMTNMTGQDIMTKKESYGERSMMDTKYGHADALNATINIEQAMFEGISSKINVTLTEAISTAEQSVGNNSFVMSAKGEEKNGFIVYSIVLGTPDMNFYKVIVDPGNGEVLQSEQMSKMEWMMMMHSDKEQKDMDMMKGMHQGYGQDKGMHGGGGGYDRDSEYQSGW